MPVFDFIRNSDGAKGSKRLVEVNVASIHPNPYQPRATFDEESIAELARMLGGVKITDAVYRNAREMKEIADAVR